MTEFPAAHCFDVTCSVCDAELGTGRDCENCLIIARRAAQKRLDAFQATEAAKMLKRAA